MESGIRHNWSTDFGPISSIQRAKSQYKNIMNRAKGLARHKEVKMLVNCLRFEMFRRC